MKCPADVYQASPRPYHGLPDIDYPFHDRTIVVTHCGHIKTHKPDIVVHFDADGLPGEDRAEIDFFLAQTVWIKIARMLRSGDSSPRTTGESLRPKSVSYVVGTMCYSYVSGPDLENDGRLEGTRTPDLYRVKGQLTNTLNNLESDGDRLSTPKYV